MGDNKHISQKVKSLYDVLKSNGEDVGSEQEFNDWFLKPGQEGYKNRKYLWDTFNQHGADVGANYEEFAGWLGLKSASQAQSSASAAKKPYGNTFGQSQMPTLSDAVSRKTNSANEWTQRELGVYDTKKDLKREASKAAKQAQNPTKEQSQKFMQQIKDEADYRQATGNGLSDFAKGMPGSDFLTPTLKRNEDGSVVTGDNGEPLIGFSSDETKKAASRYLGEKAAELEEQEAYEAAHTPKPIKGFGEAFKQGTKMMWEGLKNFGAETANLITGSNQEYIDAINHLDLASEYNKSDTYKDYGINSKLWRSLKDGVIDNRILRRLNIPIGMAVEKLAGMFENKALRDALERNNYSISAARKELEEKARANESWGDRVKRDVSDAMKNQRPTEGFGAWVGNIAPQMVPTVAALAASVATKSPKFAKGIGYLNLGTLSASTAGLSMSDARESGANDLQTWGVGLLDGAIEMWTEKVPFDRYTKRLLGFNSKAVNEAVTDALSRPNSPARSELKKLLAKANAKLGGKLFGKKNVKDFAGDILAEGLSEFTAEALETITPMIYQNPEEYPTLSEILMNGLEGAKAGVFMGSVLGASSKGLQYAQNKHRLKQQGYIDVAQVQNSEDVSDVSVVEILGKDKDGGIIVRDGDEVRTVKNSDIQISHRFTYDEFNKAKMEHDADSDEALEDAIKDNNSAGYNAADETEAATFETEYAAAKAKADETFDEETLALLDDNPVYTLSALRSSEEFTDEALAIAVDYVNAKAARDGAEQRMEDDLDSEMDAARGEVTQRINGDDFMIHGAQMKADNADGTPKRVHIISGNVSMREDGSVDAAKSSQTIVVRDAATGKVEMVSPEHIRSVDEAIDPQEEYSNAEAAARAAYEEKKARVQEAANAAAETEEATDTAENAESSQQVKGKEEQAENQQIEEEQGNHPQIKPQAEGENLQTETQTQTEQAAAESPIVQQEEIPVEKDKKGNVVRTLYHRVPMQRTLEDLYDGSLDQEEIDRFVENLAADAKRRLASVENEKKPQIGSNKRAYLEAKRLYEEKLADARAEVEYYDNLQKEVLRVTQRGGQQTGVAEDLGGEPLSLEELAARFASEYKVTPESLKGETGMSGKELKGFVGLVAREENGGVSIERLGELLARSDEWTQLGGTPEMTQEARNMLIDAYMSGNPRSYVKQQRERFAQREAEHEMNEIENFAQAAFGMSAEEYLAYEEQALPAIINKYTGFDFDIYYAILQEQADARTNEAEANYNNSINGNTNEQQGESNGNGGSGGILQTERTADEQGERTSDEQETGGQGSVGNAGLQGVGTQGNVGEGERANTDDRRGGNGSLAGREQGGLAQEELDENGISFVLASNGTTTFGEIGEESGLQPAPIRLSEGFQGEDGKGYGLAHIEANHGEQIRNAGFSSVEEFVEFVAKNYDEDNIRVGKRRDNGNTTFLIQVQDEHDNTLFIEMSRDGSYWNVNSAGIFRKGYSNKKETVAKTEPQQPNNAISDGSSLSTDAEGGITSAEPNGEPTVSAGKVTEKENSVQTSIANAERETDTDPSEAQKKAGNYKKGHAKIDGFDVTIENPKGSMRRGTDADGKQWEQEMHNTYGYILGTEGVDGDHIDVFLSDNPANGDVFVVDQVNKDGTFDEHKVMYGFASEEEARNAYLSNYEDGWTGLGAITRVSKEEFKKWVDSSHRKTKPFAEYKGVKKAEATDNAEASNSTRSAFDNLKKQASDRMLIFKEGGNYEILYEDAKKAAEILGLPVQEKDGKTFVSFPIKDLDKNLPLLIREGVMVAITDELVNTKNQKAGKTEVPGRTEVPGNDAGNTAVSVKGSMLSEEERARLSELSARGRKNLERRELEEMLTLERKDRILRDGTYYDKPFGLKPAGEISSAEDIEENISKIIKGLKTNEGDGRFKDFEGFSYGGNYAKNAGRQIDEYLQAIIDVIPSDITKAWCESHGLETHDDVFSYGERLYNAEKTEGQNGETHGKADSQGNPLSAEVVAAVIDAMKAQATVVPTIEITDDSWKDSIKTPIGNVKMGAHQKEKLFTKGRGQQYGMLVETLSNPDIVLEEMDKTENLFHERPSSYLFVKTFQKEDGSKYIHFESVTVSQEGMEVSVSSHIIRENQLKNKLKSDRLLYKATALDAPAITSAEQPIKGGSLSSEGKVTEKNNSAQQGSKETDKAEGLDGGKSKKLSTDTKIDDVGERLEGARKDMRRKIAESLANVTEADLIEKPFGKVYKKPDLKKAVESGALREKDAIFYEALFSMVDQQKPKVTQRDMRSKRYIPDYKTKAERWAADTFKQMEVLRQFMELDEPGRDAMIERMLADRYPTREQELADIEKRKSWNDNNGHKYEWGEMTTPNPLWVTYEVMNRMGYDVGGKLDIPFGVVKANTSGTGYSIENLKGEYAIIFGSSMTLDEAIDRIVYLAKLKRGDADISHPTQLFDFHATKSEMGESGRFRVVWGRDFKTREFDSKEEADAFASTKSGAYVSPIKEVKRWFGYKVRFIHPLTGEKMLVDDTEFDSKEEAKAYFDENFEQINDATNEKLEAERSKKGEKKTLTPDDVVNVTMVKSGEGWSYAVVVDKKYANNNGMAHIIKDGFASSKDARAYADKVKDDIFNAIQKHKKEEKSVVFFDAGEDSRIGEDWRNGKDVEAEDFMNTFGFRGVQFGNWTNQEDRQMAINQAYDAFMDLASLIGVSPSALSLNGELGIAFGARGMGNASAHYEPNNVVINLTKTRGAGSLAHEWWHAIDNYLSRRAGKSLGMVTSNRNIEMREELRNAFNAMLDMVGNSDYAKRSAKKGDYWGRIEEVTARLLSEWVDSELKNNGKLNTFLSRGASIERYQKHNYNVYTALEKLSGREPMSFEEYKETPESLIGIPYPTAKEVEQFGVSLRNIFDTLQEKVDEETGKIALFHKLEGNTKPVTKQDAALRDALIDDVLRGAAGMEVITDAEGQRVLDEENLGDVRKRKVSAVRFFRTPDGHAYGFTMGGKIYIDARIAGADTPIHEYTHLWAEALRKANPNEWGNIVGLMKGSPLWEGIKKKYPELKTDSEIADEVLAHYSGKRGAERLRKAQDDALKNGNGILEKTAAVAAINNVRTALKRFWKGVADFFGVHFNSAEEVADKVLSDLLNGVKPEVTGKTDAALAKEEADIIAKTKADGTYLKAPNGKPTNLTPRQWVQVRTKAFKKWFGDWEKRARIEKLRKSESASITGKEIEITDDYKQNKKNALEYGKRLQGEYTNADTGVSVQLQRVRRNGGIKEVLQHNYKDAAHILSVSAIPQIIEKSVYIESEANNDTAKNPDVVEYQHFVCGLKIGNEDYTVHSLVAVDKHGNRYYDHNLTHIEKTKLLDSIERQAVKGQGFDTTSSTELTTLNGYKGKKLLELLQTDCSKVVDENGEPKVALHGTPNTFTAFDKSKIGSSNDPGWLGSGFYFYGNNEDYARSYSRGGNLMEVFLNIRDPYYASYSEMERLAEENNQEASNEFRGMVEDEGCDGVYYNADLNEEWVAFEPTQIKSATDNVGTFDGSNPDIRYQFVGENGSESAAETDISEAEELARDGRGAYTSDEVSMENDPWSKMAGYNIRSKKERMAFAERERRRMVAAVTELAERLGIAGDVEIVTDLSGLQGRQRRAKGIYRKSSGKITIYIPNHINVADAVATFLHEAVAHRGLRNLFGKHFDEFLDKVYANSNSEIRSAIDALAKKKKLSTHTATEEYLAGLAEKTDFEHLPYNGWLQRVKTFFIEMLSKMGIKALDTTTLTDNELRYILWRSYRYMAGKDKGIIDFVEDTAMKMKLGVGYSEKEGASGAAEVAGKTDVSAKNTKNSARSVFDNLKKQQAFDKMFLFKVGDNYEILYEDAKSASEILGLPLQEKDGKEFVSFPVKDLDKNLALLVRGGAYVAVDNNPAQEEADVEVDELFREAAEVDKVKAATIYNNRIKSGMYQTYEAMLDSMAGLKEAMMSVLKAEGSSIKYIEDVPDSENAYLGENRLSSINEAECEAFQRTLFDPLLREVAHIAKTDKERRELTDYMMMKHGLERNAYMRKEAAKKKEETDRDFAGLTTLLGIEDVYEAEAEAQRIVEEYEADHKTDILWSRVKDVTQATLRKSYECGIISKDTFYKTILMYDHYIPLRGFSDKTSSEEYTYLNHSESSFNAPIRTARGRSSKADDPILQMQLMAESAILQGNRNRFVKQRFLNFAERHPSDLISVRSVWLKYDDALEEWRPVFADINEYDTPEEALRKQEEFDERMESLAESDKEHFKKQSEHPEIPYRVVEKRDLREHQVLVKRGGIDYVLTINGSPRAAQAVNGKTNPDNVGDNAVDRVLEFCGNINRTLSMLYTTASPDFVVGNFARDCIYANTMVWAKEGAKYAAKFNANYAMLSKPGRMKLLFEKYRKGRLDMSNERERLFLMFIKNGGETGFLRMGDVDQYRDKIKKKLRGASAKIPAGEMIASAATWIGEVGRAVETQARFAAFMTSMQAGRSIGRSIWDAKEISVNFNKKGAGDKFIGGADQTKVGNVSAFASALGRCLYVFWNAGLQGTFNNFGKTLVRNPKKTTAVMAASFALGLIVSMLGKMAGDDDGDDNGDDEETDTFGYYDISKHIRRQNLVVKIPGKKSWFKLPLPIEFRAMYGMGELAGSTIFGGEPLSAGDMLAQVSQLAPIDAMEGWRALIPSLAKPAADAYVNETWYGTPIYKDTPFNKYLPDWTKAPKNTNKYLVDLAETLNEMTGGDKYSKGKIDINPAIWEYLLRQYGGGIFTVASQLTSLYSVANGSKEADWRYVPLLNRFVMSSGDHKATPGLNERYFEIMDKLKSDDSRISAIKKDYAIGQEEQRKLIGEVVNDEMYRTLKAFDEEYKARKEGLYYYQNIGDVENAKKAAREIKELKMRAVEYANKKEKED